MGGEDPPSDERQPLTRPPYERQPLVRPPYERQPLIGSQRVLVERNRAWNCIGTIIDHPTRCIAVFCAGSIILAVLVTLIVVLGRHRDPVVTTTTTTMVVPIQKHFRMVCFDGNSIVSRADGSGVRISELNVGDQVLVAHFNANGNIALRSSPILAIDVYQHYNRLLPLHYREIYTTINSTALHITSSHSLLVRKKHKSYAEYLFAFQINIGDHLYFAEEDDRSTIEVTVTRIDDAIFFDAYAPLTFEGNIVINHLIVSCYGTFTHSTGHLIKMARRWWLYWDLGWIFISI